MIETLQSLRIVFALTVMLAHFSYAGIEGHSTGVGPMFFMLMTGFVMSRSYGDRVLQGKFQMKSFLLHRLFKFYPLHLLCLLAFVAINRNTLTGRDLMALLPNVLLLHSWIPLPQCYFSANAVSWYLSDLMLFLLLFPSLYRWIARMRLRMMAFTAMLLLAIYVIYVELLSTDDLNYWLYIFPPVRLLDFIWGMMIWRLYQLRPSCGHFRLPSIVETIMATAVIITIVTYPIHERWHYALIHWIVMLPLFIVFLQGNTHGGIISRLLRSPAIVYMGGFTLDTYLLHQIIFAVLLNNAQKASLQWPYPVMLVASIAIVLLMSYIVHTCFVTPVNKRLLTIISDRHSRS